MYYAYNVLIILIFFNTIEPQERRFAPLVKYAIFERGWSVASPWVPCVMGAGPIEAPRIEFGMRLLRLIVPRSVVTVGVVVAVAGWGVPRLVAMLVGVILGSVSIMPAIAAIAAGKTDSCHHH